MSLHRILILTSCLTSTVLGTACELGGKAGDDTSNDEGDTGDLGEPASFGGACGEEVASVVAGLDAPLPGFDEVAGDFVAMVEGTFDGEFNWLPDDDVPVTVVHGGTASPLTVTVTYEGGLIRLTEVELVGQPPQGEGGPEGQALCGNILQIHVTLGFASEDGLFAESFEVPITVYSHDEWVSPSFSFSLDMDALQGQLALEDFVVDGGVVSDLVLAGQFDGEIVSGSLNVETEPTGLAGIDPIGGFDAVR